MMDADYPAAHSMDTAWFAVDRDGHVAYFDTGEAGAAPDQAIGGDDAYGLLEQLARMVPPCDVLHDLTGHTLPGSKPERHSSHADMPGLFFLRSLDAVQAELAAGTARQVLAREGVAVIVAHPTQGLVDRLHDAGACLGCFWHYERTSEELPDPARLGLYFYSHLCENWISGPYGRECLLEKPIHVDQLPPDLRNAVKQLRFNFSFPDMTYIQPLEHTDCVSWGSAWLSADGKTRKPMPGREDEFEEYDEDEEE